MEQHHDGEHRGSSEHRSGEHQGNHRTSDHKR
jgi:hypothetical protein